MFGTGINMETLKALEMIEELARKSKNGIKPFSEVTKETKDEFIFYDDKYKEKENGYPIACMIIADEGDENIHSISTYDHYVITDRDYTVRVKEDEDGRKYVEFRKHSRIIIIEDGRWYFA